MPKGTLLFDAYLWNEAGHKTSIGPGKTRIEAGTQVEILPDDTAVANNTRVRLIADARLKGINGVLPAGTEGHVTTGKIKLSGDDLLAQLQIQKPAINGLGKAPASAWEPDDVYVTELSNVIGACDAIDDLTRLFLSNETDIGKWRRAAQGLSGVQVVAGVGLLGLGIGALIATGGAATPLLVALGVSGSSLAAVSGLGAGVSKGTMENRMRQTTHRVMAGTKDTAVPIAAPFGKQAVVDAVKAGSGAAAGNAVAGSLTAFSGVAAAGLGGKALYDLNRVDPARIWNFIEWPEILATLEIDLDKLQRERLCAPNLQRYFDLAIAKVSETLHGIPVHKIA